MSELPQSSPSSTSPRHLGPASSECTQALAAKQIFAEVDNSGCGTGCTGCSTEGKTLRRFSRVGWARAHSRL